MAFPVSGSGSGTPGAQGPAGVSPICQYSADGVSGWSATETPGVSKYWRWSFNNGSTWGSASKYVADVSDIPNATTTTVGVVSIGDGLAVTAGKASAKLGSGLAFDVSKNVIVDAANLDVTTLKNASTLVLGSYRGAITGTSTLATFANAAKGDFWICTATVTISAQVFNPGDQLWCKTAVTGTPADLTSFSYVPNTLSQATTTAFGTVKIGGVTPAALGTAAEGTSVAAARADHVHTLPTIPAASAATPLDLGTAAVGTSAAYARADHVHQTIAEFTGATALTDGVAGLVKKPLMAEVGKFLRGDGTWAAAGGGTDNVQAMTGTGSITAWSSVVTLNISANATITIPTVVGNTGNSIKFIRLDNTAFTVTLAAQSGQIITLQNGGVELNVQNGSLTVEAIDATNARQTANISQTVKAEYGEVLMSANQNITALTYTAVTNMPTITLPSAGTYEVSYNIVAAINANNVLSTQLYNTTGAAVVPRTLKNIWAGSTSNGVDAVVSASAQLTVSGPTIIQLQAKTGAGTQIIRSITTAEANSSLSYRKIGGFAPVTGQTVDYFNIRASASQTTGLTASSPILFSTPVSEGSGISFNAGVFTLAANKTYLIRGAVSAIVVGTELMYRWKNITSGSYIGSAGDILPAISRTTMAEAVITTSATTTIQLEITYNNGVTSLDYPADGRVSWATIQQLGSSAVVAPASYSVNTEYVSPDQHGGIYGTVYRTYFGATLPSYLTAGNTVSAIIDYKIWASYTANNRRYVIGGWSADGTNYCELDLTGLTGNGNLILSAAGFTVIRGWADYTK